MILGVNQEPICPDQSPSRLTSSVRCRTTRRHVCRTTACIGARRADISTLLLNNIMEGRQKKAPKGEGYTVRVSGKMVLKSSLLEEQVAKAQQAVR